MMFKKIRKGLRALWCFCWGNVFSIFTYKRKYLKGKYFKGRFGGITSLGWRWVMTDCMSRLFLGLNKGIPFPVSPQNFIANPKNIHFDVDDLNNFQGMGKYFQALDDGHIYIGKGCWIAPNVGLVTTNHDLADPDRHLLGQDIVLGEACWIGMNSVILPGVTLGPHTTVGAGAVVTKSFPEGYCVIAGNPAKKIKDVAKVSGGTSEGEL